MIEVILLGITSIVIVFKIFRHPTVDVETIYGALSVYIMIGIFFAFTDSIVGSLAPPFFASVQDATLKEYLYFSFVTLTTLGYGDFVPKGDLPRTLAVIEAVLGQLYLVTVVALLVSNFTRRQPPSSK